MYICIHYTYKKIKIVSLNQTLNNVWPYTVWNILCNAFWYIVKSELVHVLIFLKVKWLYMFWYISTSSWYQLHVINVTRISVWNIAMNLTIPAKASKTQVEGFPVLGKLRLFSDNMKGNLNQILSSITTTCCCRMLCTS